MNLLLDTHAFLWWLSDPALLSSGAADAVADRRNRVFLSAASAWEITTKHRIGKLPGVAPIVDDLARQVEAEGFRMLDIGFAHACLAGSLRHEHRDPFDRMLIAQALTGNLQLVSNEALFDDFAVQRLW